MVDFKFGLADALAAALNDLRAREAEIERLTAALEEAKADRDEALKLLPVVAENWKTSLQEAVASARREEREACAADLRTLKNGSALRDSLIDIFSGVLLNNRARTDGKPGT